MRMLLGVKKVAKWALTSAPLLSTLYYRYRLRKSPLDDKLLRGKMQHVAHGIDLRIGQGRKVPMADIRELRFLLATMGRRGMEADGPTAWAANLLAMAEHGLRPKEAAPPRPPGAVSVAAEVPAVPLARAIMERRSVRNWTADPVDLEDLRRSIDVAKWAPSSCNRQLWQTLIVQDAAGKEFLARYFPNRFYLEAPVLVVVLMKTGLYGQGEKHFACLDGGAFIQNLLLVLHAKGYGACWIGFKGWDCAGNVFVDRGNYEKFYEHFGLDKELLPISMIAVGRPAAVPPAPPRQDIQNIVIG
jgi:nitroreductase